MDHSLSLPKSEASLNTVAMLVRPQWRRGFGVPGLGGIIDSVRGDVKDHFIRRKTAFESDDTVGMSLTSSGRGILFDQSLQNLLSIMTRNQTHVWVFPYHP